MEITLLHNPKAGNGTPPKKDLIKLFERAGHSVTYHSTKSDHLSSALKKPGDLVVVAGGDGTVGKAARRLIGHNVALAILPVGTANNIATALGLKDVPERIIRGLSTARRRKFDIGLATGPWGNRPFLEAAGSGLFPRMLSHHESNRQESVADPVDTEGGVRGGLALLQQVLGGFPGHEYVLRLDGKTLAGKFLLVEALNIRAIGPGFELAPEADPADGALDVVLVGEDQREDLHQHLGAHRWNRRRIPFSVRRAHRVSLACAATEFHIDDQLWPDGFEPAADARRSGHIQVEFSVLAGALQLLVPRTQAGGKPRR